jgi:hypothetical protein
VAGGWLGALAGGAGAALVLSNPIGWAGGLMVLGGGLIGGYVGSRARGAAVSAPKPPGQ